MSWRHTAVIVSQRHTFLNSAVCGVSGQLHGHSDFLQTEETLLLTERETKWARIPIWTIRNIKKLFTSITKKMQRYTIYLFLWNPLHVSGGFSDHHQELKNCIYSIRYLVETFLLPATVVEDMELHGVPSLPRVTLHLAGYTWKYLDIIFKKQLTRTATWPTLMANFI